MSGLRVRAHRVPCPFCGKLVPEAEIEEHIRTHVAEERASGFAFDVKPGEMLKVVYGRYAWYVLVTSVRTLPIIRGIDVYGNEVKLDLRKAMLVAKLTPEQAQEVLKRVYRRRSKKAESSQKEAKEAAGEGKEEEQTGYKRQTGKRRKKAEEVEKSEEQPDRS